MTNEMVVALVSIGAASILGLIAWLGKTTLDSLRDGLDDAQAHSNSVEKRVMQMEIDNLKFQVAASDTYVKRGDHTPVLSEIFRKIETTNTKIDSLSDKFGTKMDAQHEALSRKLDNKQDRQDRRLND